MIDERFETLDPDRWLDAYLPAWSSRSAASATYACTAEGLVLTIPPAHPRWCPGLHDEPPLRVSAVQSGHWSGPLGSTRGQQPFRDGLVVRDEIPPLWGVVVHHGRIEVECRALLDPASMFSAWTIGMEDEPERCGEICLVEVFGDTVGDGRAAVGSGIHPFRDPALVEEFGADEREIGVADWHTYAIDWTPDGVAWTIDGERVRTSSQSPGYPLLLVLGVFDFPGRPGGTPGFEPALHVRRVVVDGDLVTAP